MENASPIIIDQAWIAYENFVLLRTEKPDRRILRLNGFVSLIMKPLAQRFSIVGLVACATMCAQGDEVYNVGNGVSSPRVVHQVAPEHPSKGFRISGTVLIALIVTSKGEPDDVKVVRSLEKDVDQSAVDAVKQWRFEPGTKDGKPVAVKISVEIRFHDL